MTRHLPNESLLEFINRTLCHERPRRIAEIAADVDTRYFEPSFVFAPAFPKLKES